MSFNNWLDTFLTEKEIDLEDTFGLNSSDGTWNLMPYAVVVEHIYIAPKSEQDAIKDTLVKIDFKNGDVRHFLRHLAKALVG